MNAHDVSAGFVLLKIQSNVAQLDVGHADLLDTPYARSEDPTSRKRAILVDCCGIQWRPAEEPVKSPNVRPSRSILSDVLNV